MMKIWVNKLGINVDVVSVDEALQTGSEEIGRVLPDDLDPRIEKEIEGVGHIYAESTKTGFCLIYVRWELLSGKGWRR
jgi:tRNA(Ile)-lysidine synthase TilS/MesJ